MGHILKIVMTIKHSIEQVPAMVDGGYCWWKPETFEGGFQELRRARSD